MLVLASPVCGSWGSLASFLTGLATVWSLCSCSARGSAFSAFPICSCFVILVLSDGIVVSGWSSGDGVGSGTGSGDGVGSGTGSGDGVGSGTGSGVGVGSGTGSGVGVGSGTDSGA